MAAIKLLVFLCMPVPIIKLQCKDTSLEILAALCLDLTQQSSIVQILLLYLHWQNAMGVCTCDLTSHCVCRRLLALFQILDMSKSDQLTAEC